MEIKRVTDFGLGILTIPEADFFDLPPRIRELIRTYGRPTPAPLGTLKFELATYRVDEILAAMRALPKPSAGSA
jgi:hypothetical protein